jgi:hypothetical protein
MLGYHTFHSNSDLWKVISANKIAIPIASGICHDIQHSQSQTLSKVLLDITTPPFSHGQLYVALSQVCDCKNIVMYLSEEQLILNDSHSTGFMPTVNNIVYQDVLVHNS